jgi:hypothetical protein
LVVNLKVESLRLRGSRTSAERQYEEKKLPSISMLEKYPSAKETEYLTDVASIIVEIRW